MNQIFFTKSFLSNWHRQFQIFQIRGIQQHITFSILTNYQEKPG
jgi:hypothetical protein